jgi:hypothetical protein
MAEVGATSLLNRCSRSVAELKTPSVSQRCPVVLPLRLLLLHKLNKAEIIPEII